MSSTTFEAARALDRAVAVAAAAPPVAGRPSRLGIHLGHRLRRALCRRVRGVRGLSGRLWIVDGPHAGAFTARCFPTRSTAHGGQHGALCRHRREFENVRRAAAVGLLHAQAAGGPRVSCSSTCCPGRCRRCRPSSRSTGCSMASGACSTTRCGICSTSTDRVGSTPRAGLRSARLSPRISGNGCRSGP